GDVRGGDARRCTPRAARAVPVDERRRPCPRAVPLPARRVGPLPRDRLRAVPLLAGIRVRSGRARADDPHAVPARRARRAPRVVRAAVPRVARALVPLGARGPARGAHPSDTPAPRGDRLGTRRSRVVRRRRLPAPARHRGPVRALRRAPGGREELGTAARRVRGRERAVEAAVLARHDGDEPGPGAARDRRPRGRPRVLRDARPQRRVRRGGRVPPAVALRELLAHDHGGLARGHARHRERRERGRPLALRPIRRGPALRRRRRAGAVPSVRRRRARGRSRDRVGGACVRPRQLHVARRPRPRRAHAGRLAARALNAEETSTLRILMVTPYPPIRDGIANYAMQEVKRLLAEGHDVEVLSPEPSAAHHHLELTSRRGPLALAKRTGAYDRVIVQFHPDMFFPVLATYRRRLETTLGLLAAFRTAHDVEVRVHEVNYDTGRGRSVLAVATRAMWGAVDRISVHTDEERRLFADAFRVPLARIDTLHHGESFRRRTDATRDEARARLGVPADAFMFLSIGFVQPHKGFDRAVRAFARLGAVDPAAPRRIDVVGSLRVEEPEYVGYMEDLRDLVEQTPGAFLHDGYVGDETFDLWLVASD